MTIYANETDYTSLDTSKLLKDAEQSLLEYQQLTIAYNNGKCSRTDATLLKQEIYDKSPYTDIWDFTTDFIKFNNGLPICIDIKLVRKGDL